jgi:hypothetical protein
VGDPLHLLAHVGVVLRDALAPAAVVALALAAALGLTRARGRRARRRPPPGTAERPAAPVWAELVLGRENVATPYEVSKLFDGLAGALRRGGPRRLLFGADPLALKIAHDPATRTVRFFVQARRDAHPLLAGRLRA